MSTWLRALITLSMLLLAGCSSSAPERGSTTTAASAPVVVYRELERARVAAGTAIRATVLSENTTGRLIWDATCAAKGWLDLGLVGQGIAFEPAHSLIACAPTLQLPPGTGRWPATTYPSCSRAPRAAGAQRLECSVEGGVPPLPAGRYETRIVVVGLPATTELAPPTVVALEHARG